MLKQTNESSGTEAAPQTETKARTKTVTRSISMPANMLSQITRLSKTHDVSLSKVIQALVKSANVDDIQFRKLEPTELIGVSISKSLAAAIRAHAKANKKTIRSVVEDAFRLYLKSQSSKSQS